MGAGASVSKEEVKGLPQYTIMGGDAKFDELKGEDGKVALDKVEDPYLLYGGSYAGDAKDAPDFKYLTFAEVPKFTDKHKSLMAKTLTPELFEKLKNVKSSKVHTVHFANLQNPPLGLSLRTTRPPAVYLNTRTLSCSVFSSVFSRATPCPTA